MLGSVAVSAVSADVLPYISVAIKGSFFKLGMCNIFFFFFFFTGTMTTCHSKFIGTHIEIHILQK